MSDLRLERIEKQLSGALDWLLRITREAEAFNDQALADVLFDHYCDLKVLHDHLRSGKRPTARSLARV